MTKIIIKSFVLVLFAYSYCFSSCQWSGNTGTVSSPYDYSDINDCISESSSKTGRVSIIIPDSNMTQTGHVSINMQSGFDNVTSITISGQNSCFVDTSDIPTECKTKLRDFYVSYTGKEGKFFRLSNIQIRGTSGITVDGDSKTWRIDHIYFESVSGHQSRRLIWISKSTDGWLTEGLIDHNYIKNPSWGSFVHYQPAADGGNNEWIIGPQLGTEHAIYLENNKFEYGAGNYYFTENNGASRWVVRFNDITNGHIAGHDYSTDGYRGSLKAEIYNNSFTFTENDSYNVFYRGGSSGVFYNNKIIIPGTETIRVLLSVFRRSYNTNCAFDSGNATLNTSSDYVQTCSEIGGSCIKIDGDNESPTGYPCRDQPGVSGNNPQVGGGAPFLVWNNTINSGNFTVSGLADYVVENREYCVAFTTMPSSCNGIATTYTPYTYPHPLRGLMKQTLSGGSLGGGAMR